MGKCVHVPLLAACISAAATAGAIPLTVRVTSGDPVRSIDFAGQTGLVPLVKSADGTRFTGTITIAAGDSVSQPIVINYADFGYPALLRVYKHLPSVEFPVEVRLPTSCTVSKIISVESQTTDLGTAISKSIQAARLANIEGNDRCDAQLRARAVTAKFRNARRMAQLSQGLFVVPDQLIAEYKSLPIARTAQAEITRYETEALELQGVRLVAARAEAQREGEFATAAAIQQVIVEEADSSVEVRDAFANVGLSADRIAADSDFLSTMARQEVQAERPN